MFKIRTHEGQTAGVSMLTPSWVVYKHWTDNGREGMRGRQAENSKMEIILIFLPLGFDALPFWSATFQSPDHRYFHTTSGTVVRMGKSKYRTWTYMDHNSTTDSTWTWTYVWSGKWEVPRENIVSCCACALCIEAEIGELFKNMLRIYLRLGHSTVRFGEYLFGRPKIAWDFRI